MGYFKDPSLELTKENKIYDKQGDCRLETQQILEDRCVLELSNNNCELYGRSWDIKE